MKALEQYDFHTFNVRFMGKTYKMGIEDLLRHSSRGKKPYGHVDRHHNCRCSFVCMCATLAKKLEIRA